MRRKETTMKPWIDVAQDRDQWKTLVSTIMNLQVPLNSGKFFSNYTSGSLSRRAYLHGVSSIR
jgi:hypothetical protein